MGRLDDRVAVVSGAASGIGRAIALRLAEDGAQLGLIDIKDQAETVGLVRAEGGAVEAWACDVTDEGQVARAFEGIGSRFGRIDVLVNNAGILSDRKPWHEHTKADVERFISVNYVGYFLVMKAAYPLLRKSTVPARIVNVASRTFFSAPPGQMAYIASKGAVIGMTRVLARELGVEGITVNAVMPGQVATPGTMEFTTEDTFNQTMQAQAIKQRGQPEDLANLVAFVASDDARLITGQTIIVDGGGFMH
jgi:NAD(P)-dependent dehydrogenase (short-subunit alcohol dehydrogenase family)